MKFLNLPDWVEGETKAELIGTETQYEFSVIWIKGNRQLSVDLIIRFEERIMNFTWPGFCNCTYVKLFPEE